MTTTTYETWCDEDGRPDPEDCGLVLAGRRLSFADLAELDDDELCDLGAGDLVAQFRASGRDQADFCDWLCETVEVSL